MTFAMGQETSIVYYLAYQYDTNKGGIKQGDQLNSYDQYWTDDDKIDSASKYASSIIDVETVGALAATNEYKMEFTPVVEGTVKIEDTGDVTYVDQAGSIYKFEDEAITGGAVATIDYTTGIITSTTLALTEATISYEYNNQIAPVQVPRIKLQTTKLVLNAKAYTLNYEYSTFAAYNLLRSQNVDLKDLLGEGAANELVAEIDALVYNDFANSGTTLSVTFNMNPTGYFDERLAI